MKRRQQVLKEARVLLREGLRPALSKPGMAIDADHILDAEEVLMAAGYSGIQTGIVLRNMLGEVESHANKERMAEHGTHSDYCRG